MKICPEHKKAMKPSQTRYGTRYTCPFCDVYAWSGPTSTPADPRTHEMRKAAHDEFDALWKTSKERRALYSELSIYMNKHVKHTHIGMFNKGECIKVLNFVQKRKDAKCQED